MFYLGISLIFLIVATYIDRLLQTLVFQNFDSTFISSICCVIPYVMSWHVINHTKEIWHKKFQKGEKSFASLFFSSKSYVKMISAKLKWILNNMIYIFCDNYHIISFVYDSMISGNNIFFSRKALQQNS